MSKCDVHALPSECLLDPRIPQLLTEVCDRCPPVDCAETTCSNYTYEGPGVCTAATQADDDALSRLAFDLLVNNAFGPCQGAVWTAFLVAMQLAVGNRPVDFLSGLASSTYFKGIDLYQLADEMPASWKYGYDLFPFPFWSNTRSLGEDLKFHSEFMLAHHWICDDLHKTELVRGKYVLRAGHDKPECGCAVRATDSQLVRRCRERRRKQSHPGMRGYVASKILSGSVVPVLIPLNMSFALITQDQVPRRPNVSSIAEIECPSLEDQASYFAQQSDNDTNFTRKWLLKYETRAGDVLGRPGRGCEEPAAEWRFDLRIYHKCVLVVILERLQLAPQSNVLDWGSGCGHKLTWAAQLYDINGLGIDIVAGNIKWAEKHSIGKFCQLDGRFVAWLPDNFFDAVISYAALTHLNPDDQCNVVLELVSKVRVGGRLWFGWNSPHVWRLPEEFEAVPENDRFGFWNDCFTSAVQSRAQWASGEVAAHWETEGEEFIFPDDDQQHDTYLFMRPAYSLFVERVTSVAFHQLV